MSGSGKVQIGAEIIISNVNMGVNNKGVCYFVSIDVPDGKGRFLYISGRYTR